MLGLFILAFIIGEACFWIGLLQLDTLFWDLVDYHEAKLYLWIPEFNISAKNAFIIMWLSTAIGFHIALVSLLFLGGLIP